MDVHCTLAHTTHTKVPNLPRYVYIRFVLLCEAWMWFPSHPNNLKMKKDVPL